MCETCQELGLECRCSVCGGFDWVVDVYVWEKSPVAFVGRLCGECRVKWTGANRGQVSL